MPCDQPEKSSGLGLCQMLASPQKAAPRLGPATSLRAFEYLQGGAGSKLGEAPCMRRYRKPGINADWRCCHVSWQGDSGVVQVCQEGGGAGRGLAC